MRNSFCTEIIYENNKLSKFLTLIANSFIIRQSLEGTVVNRALSSLKEDLL